MSLQERLQSIATETTAMNPVEKILLNLDEVTAAMLRNLLTDRRVSTRIIHAALKDEGYKIGRDTVADYRTKLNARSEKIGEVS